MQIRPFILKESNLRSIQSHRWELAILPWGATESHNYHLPYYTDVLQVEAIVEKAAEMAWHQGHKAMVLPCVPFGVNCAQLEVPFNLNMNPSTQFLVLKDLVESLERQGIKKLLIVNGHGGNAFSHMVRELYKDYQLFIAVMDWYKLVDMRAMFIEPGDHAGEMESSLMLYLYPEWVADLSTAGSGAYKVFKSQALRTYKAWAQRGWLGQTTEDTGIGNPAQATAQKGEQLFEMCCQQMAEVIAELAVLELAALYQEPEPS